jgi:type I restriction enzyme S subunit
MGAWPTAKLSEVAQIERNGIASEAIETGTKYLGLEHIESGGKILGFADVEAGELASTKFQFTSDHVLYGKLRPYLAKIALPNFDGICSTDIVPIKPKSRLDKRYLAYFLRQPEMVAFANSRAAGANLPRLSPKALADFEIPLPPMEEQKRIAAILDQADDIRRKRQHAIDRLNQLGQAIFHEMFGDPAMRTVSLGEVCQFQYGNSLPASIRDGIGYDVYGSNGVVGSHNKGLTKGPTLIIGRKGSVGEINFSDSPCWPIDTTYYVDSSSTQQNLRWLYYALQNLKLQSLNKATGVPGLNRNDAYRLEIPLPPLEEQNLFADRVQEIDEFLGRMSETLSVNDALFTSLQHRAFAGEL